MVTKDLDKMRYQNENNSIFNLSYDAARTRGVLRAKSFLKL